MEMTFTIEVLYKGQTNTIGLEKAEVIVGRSTPKALVDLDLNPDSKVSRKHLRLSSEYNMADNKFEPWIKDLGSSKGTFVNGKLLDAPMKIYREDEILVGETTLYVHLAKKEQPKTTKEEHQKPETPKSLQMGRVGADPEKKPSPKPPSGTPGEKPSPKPPSGTPGEKPSPKPPPSSEVKSTTLPNEAAGFVAHSIEDLAVVINRYARENKMQPIQTSIAQEDKGDRASFRGLAIFASL